MLSAKGAKTENATTTEIAVIGANAVALNQARPASLQDLNAGVVEGLDQMFESNRVGLDGTDFEYKGTERREREVIMNVVRAKKLYQHWTEDGQLCQSFDGKVATDGIVCASCEHKQAKTCKFKFEVVWVEPGDETGAEYLITLPTVSAIQFVDYLKALQKQGLGVGQVLTRMTIDRRTNPSNNNKYSVVNFELAQVLDAVS